MPDLAFGLIVAITLGSAFMVVQGKQLLYSAIALLFTFFGVAVCTYLCGLILWQLSKS